MQDNNSPPSSWVINQSVVLPAAVQMEGKS